jgi:hypothetical protein
VKRKEFQFRIETGSFCVIELRQTRRELARVGLQTKQKNKLLLHFAEQHSFTCTPVTSTSSTSVSTVTTALRANPKVEFQHINL